MVEEEKNEDKGQVDLEGFEGSSLSYPLIETLSEQSCVLSGISDCSNVSADVAQNNSTKEKASKIDLHLKKMHSLVYYKKVHKQFCCQTNEVVQMNAMQRAGSTQNSTYTQFLKKTVVLLLKLCFNK